jgi:hypothetical protein
MTPCFADIPAVVQYKHNDQTYLLIEVIEVRKGCHKYKCLDTDYPLVISKAEYLEHRNELKWVPDNRPYNVQHPWLTRLVIITNIANTALNILGVCKL